MAPTSYGKPRRRVAELLCYEKCRAGTCKDAERCLTAYPAPGYSWFETYLQEADALLAASPPQPTSDVPCRFGCEGAVGIYHVPHGCLCWSDPIQALCQQHAVQAESEGPINLIARPFGVRPSDGGEYDRGFNDALEAAAELAEVVKNAPLANAARSLKRPPVPQEDDRKEEG